MTSLTTLEIGDKGTLREEFYSDTGLPREVTVIAVDHFRVTVEGEVVTTNQRPSGKVVTNTIVVPVRGMEEKLRQRYDFGETP